MFPSQHRLKPFISRVLIMTFCCFFNKKGTDWLLLFRWLCAEQKRQGIHKLWLRYHKTRRELALLHACQHEQQVRIQTAQLLAAGPRARVSGPSERQRALSTEQPGRALRLQLRCRGLLHIWRDPHRQRVASPGMGSDNPPSQAGTPTNLIWRQAEVYRSESSHFMLRKC